MHISYKPLWHTLLERDMRKEDLRLAAGMATNMIANMSKEGKHISMDTLARICETLNCEITDVIELVPDEPASTGGKEHERDVYKRQPLNQPFLRSVFGHFPRFQPFLEVFAGLALDQLLKGFPHGLLPGELPHHHKTDFIFLLFAFFHRLPP